MKAPKIDIPHGNEVTTEPQRQALEAMSNDLVNKLNTMVAEQEQRAHDFAAQQHSLSSLPTCNVPELVAAPQLSPVAAPAPKQPPYRAPRPAAARPPRQQADSTPNLPNIPPPQPPLPNQTGSGWTDHLQNTVYTGTQKPTRPRKPTIIRDTHKQQDGSIGAATVGTIIFVIVMLILHSC